MRIDDIYERKCAEPSDINEHLPVLKRYASQCNHVTEFGVRHVVSTWGLIAGRPKTVHSYDLSSPGDAVIAEVQDVANEVGVSFIFFQWNVLDAHIVTTDLLFIDTYHTYTQLKSELERHSENVRKWIIMHDTETFGEKGEANEENGLNYAIREFLEANPIWSEVRRLTNNNGLTVLRHG